MVRRRLRANPRVVKRKMSNFGVKRARHHTWPQPTKPPAGAVRILPPPSQHQPGEPTANNPQTPKSLVLPLERTYSSLKPPHTATIRYRSPAILASLFSDDMIWFSFLPAAGVYAVHLSRV
jgi:hypothetical protein